MLAAAAVDELRQHALLPRRDQRALVHGHSAVHTDYEHVHGEPDEDERKPSKPDVERGEQEQQDVRRDQQRDREVPARMPERLELDLEQEPDGGQPPAPDAKPLEVPQPAPCQVADHDGENDDGEQEDHRERFPAHIVGSTPGEVQRRG
jgi:hypothetical protein